MKKKKEKKKSKFLGMIKIVFASVLVLALFQIYISHRLATAGKIVGEMEAQAVMLRAGNERLQEAMNQKSSLAVIFAKAQELGFKSVENIFYLTSEIPVALGH